MHHKKQPQPTPPPPPAHLRRKTIHLLLITVFIIPFRNKTEIHSQDTSWRHSGISPWKYHLGKQSLLKFAHYYLQSIAVREKTGARQQLVSLFSTPTVTTDGWVIGSFQSGSCPPLQCSSCSPFDLSGQSVFGTFLGCFYQKMILIISNS